ncbi:MAG TPA: AarF/ABC1/UbiB kinase family protein [Dehalococcoidia bacterium]|nr:AarF/ABC1/UbiB kinase family protein [Dehalococcoidia bacterium]
MVRHGFGFLTEAFGLAALVPTHWGIFGSHGDDVLRTTQPEHLRLALEELGPMAIKLGQILSTRPDLLPPAYIAELARLRDQTMPVPVAGIRRTIEAELGRSVDKIFAAFDDQPLATASIGQVHAAVLHDGRRVIVKVHKPGVTAQIEQDLDILFQIARLAARRGPFHEHYDFEALAEEFAWTLRSELDYIREAHNAERFRENFRGEPLVRVPAVCWDLTTERVIVQERVDGIRIDDLASLDAAGIDRAALAQRSARIVLRAVFEHGFYHADPHPGNFFVQADGTIVVLDFGIMGQIEDALRRQLIRLLAAIVERDIDRIIDAYADLGVIQREADRQALGRELHFLLDRYYGRSLREIRVNAIVGDIMVVVRRFHLVLPTQLALLLKTVAMNEGMGSQLDPGFVATNAAGDYVRQALLREYLPTTAAGRLLRTSQDLLLLLENLPVRSARLIRRLEKGDLTIHADVENLDRYLDRLDGMVTRLAISIITSAIGVSLALLLTVVQPPPLTQWFGLGLLIGFILLTALGFWLSFQMIRSLRR